jgi:hypothetical protein
VALNWLFPHPILPSQARFLLPVSECEFALESALEDLAVNSFERESGDRMQRATGAAMAGAPHRVSSALLKPLLNCKGPIEIPIEFPY